MADIDGHGYTMIRFDLGDGCFNNIVVKSYYKADLNVNLLASEYVKYKEGIWYNAKLNQLLCIANDSLVGYTFYNNRVSRIWTLPIQKMAVVIAAIPAQLLHCRYAYVGQPTIWTSIVYSKHENLKPTKENFHCEPCSLGKVKRLVSQAP
jgi:hypothetical protein